MKAEAWNSAGQMNTRFELARALGSSPAQLFKPEAAEAPASTPKPALAEMALYRRSLQPLLSPATTAALAQAASPQQWNALLLSSPEFMYR